LLATLSDDKPRVIALQPISQKEDATRLCIETCIARNWRLSMQFQMAAAGDGVAAVGRRLAMLAAVVQRQSGSRSFNRVSPPQPF
ncbi:hypothetical protein MJH54_29570, partial [Salmonella enterica subsp. enterica serovar Montevideo]|nr:hypothetical protein [Salmonella enterica subsp. enterica serovar Montevideo]